jgi:Zn-dependent oligopeptidase
MPFLRDTMVLAAGGGNAREEELAAYLSLPNVINGLDLWAHSLFDVRLIPVPLRADEGWAGAGSHGNRSAGRQGRASAGTDKGSTLVKLLAVDYSAGRNAAANGSFDARAHAAAIGDGELLGVVYLDLFYRQDKHSSAATFTIQCGRVAHDPTSPATAGAVDVTDLYPTLRGTGLGNGTASSSAAATGAAAAAAGGRYQMPVAVVSMSCRTVNPPAAAVTAGGVAPVLIHPDHLETIFHEMGHAMHSMLGRTQYQHLAGSRGELDYVEMPSTFAEFFANDPRVVSQYARAFDTDAPLSPQSPLLEFRQLRQNLFAGVDTLNEVFNGLLDQRFYGAPAAFDAHRVFPQYEVVTAADALKNALVTNNAGKTAAAAARVPAPAAGESCVLSDADAVAVAESHGFWLEPALETAEALAQAFPTTAAEAAKHAHAHPAQMFLLAHQVRAAVHPVALPVGAIPYATFSHYIAYGGTYYTYIFCRLFAWALWNKHFQAKPLNRAGGRKLRRALAAGGARQPMDLLVELLETPEAGPGAGAPVFPVTVRPRNPATGETCEPATLRPPWVPAAGRRDHLYMPFGPRHLRALTEALELFSNQVVAQGRDAIELWRKLEEKHNR